MLTKNVLLFISIVLGVFLVISVIVKSSSRIYMVDRAVSQNLPYDIFPISPNNPNVGLLLLNYSLKGIIEKITHSPTGSMIQLVSRTDEALPLLPITSSTQIIYVDVRKNRPQSWALSSLKKGLPVNITALYNIKTRQWFVTSISIFSEASVISNPTPRKHQ